MFDQYSLFDHGSAIVRQMQEFKGLENNARLSLNNLANYEDLHVASPEEFRQAKEEYKIEDPEVDERILDLEFFMENKKLRRPDRWEH